MLLLEEEIWEVYLQSAPSSSSVQVQIFFILLLVISMALGCVLYLLFSSNQHGIVCTHISCFCRDCWFFCYVPRCLDQALLDYIKLAFPAQKAGQHSSLHQQPKLVH